MSCRRQPRAVSPWFPVVKVRTNRRVASEAGPIAGYDRLVNEFVAALAGALIGGAATFCATWWQTRRVLNHEREMARDAAEDQRRAVRQEVDRGAARELLPKLPDLERVLPLIADGAHLFQGRGDRANLAMNELRDLDNSTVALLSSPEAREAWSQLRTLVTELADAVRYDDLGDSTLNEGWTDRKVARSEADIRMYIDYVRLHLLAIVDGAEPPRSVAASSTPGH